MSRIRDISCLIAFAALLASAAASLAIQLHHELADHHADRSHHGHSHAVQSGHGDHADPDLHGEETTATHAQRQHVHAAGPAHAHPPTDDSALPRQVIDHHDHASPEPLPSLAGERCTYRPQLERSAGENAASSTPSAGRWARTRKDIDAKVDPPLPTPSLRLQDQGILLLI